jgi:hypothetical protein
MQTMTLKAADAVSIASLIHAADTSRNPAAPVLAEINLTLTAGQLTAAATDRFCAVSYKAPADGPDGQLRINAAAAKFITANVKPLNKWHDPAPVVIEYDNDARTFSISQNGATIAGEWVSAKYPDVVSLFDNWQPATDATPVTLRAEFLGRLNKFLSEFKKIDLWAIELGANPRNPNRPGVTRAASGNFRFIVQPNLIKPVNITD